MLATAHMATINNFGYYASILPETQPPISQIICRVLYLKTCFYFVNNPLYCIIIIYYGLHVRMLHVRLDILQPLTAHVYRGHVSGRGGPRPRDDGLQHITKSILCYYFTSDTATHFPNYLLRFIFKNLFLFCK